MGDLVESRVPAVLEVLRGRPTAEVAARWKVDVDLLAGWVRAFVEAGTAQVTDQPVTDAARERDQFLAAFAHEVHAPLSMAKGWVEMLADGGVPPDQAHDSLVRLHAALDRLAQRTFDVELMAEVQLGRLALAPQLVPVSALAAELDDLNGIGGLGGAVEVVVDPALVRRVLRDLWQAAGTAPGPRGRRLEVEQVAGWLELRVVRDGAPLDAATSRALLDTFDLNDDATGVRIGLSLARALAAAHGGSMGVEDGSYFSGAAAGPVTLVSCLVSAVEIRETDLSDEGQLHDWWSSGQAAMAHRPVDLWPEWEVSRRALPQADPDNLVVLLSAYDGEAMVGSGLVYVPLKDNLHLAAFDVHVPPQHRRRGVGGAMLARCEAMAEAEGRTTFLADLHVPLDSDGEDRPWVEARGYSVANVDTIKVVDLAATAHLLPVLEADAAERLGDYRLVWWTDPAPEEHLASLAAAMSRFVEEIPLGDLDLKPLAWTPERLRLREARRAAQGRDQVTVVALAPSGEVAGYTNAILSPHAPRLADIGDTLVLPDHRGHRLGLAMKVLLHQQVRALHPGVQQIATGNATVNRWMNAVNEQLGYRPVDRCLELQKVLP